MDLVSLGLELETYKIKFDNSGLESILGWGMTKCGLQMVYKKDIEDLNRTNWEKQ